MNTKKLGVAAASLAAIGALVAGGAAVANAADNTATTSTSTSTSSSVPSVGANSGTTGDSGMRGPGGGMGGPGGGMRGPGGGMGGPGGGSQDTPVTGAEADKVIAAVKAKDSAATVTTVRMDPDGSYDALGTKDGAPVMFQVSKDLKTITERAGAALGLAIALGTTLVYLTGTQIMKAIGGKDYVDPTVAAWAMNGVFLVLALGLLRKVRS